MLRRRGLSLAPVRSSSSSSRTTSLRRRCRCLVSMTNCSALVLCLHHCMVPAHCCLFAQLSHCCISLPFVPSFCPYVQGVANNVGVAAAATGVIILGRMLPHSWLDLFPRGTLDSIIAYMARSKQGGAAYDFTGKPIVDINQAVKIGLASASSDTLTDYSGGSRFSR